MVIKVDIVNFLFEFGMVDVVVFCFVLMGMNWIDFIEEVYWIFCWKGEFWVVEIKFRFFSFGGLGIM